MSGFYTCPECSAEFDQEVEHPDDAIVCPECDHFDDEDEFIEND